MAEQSSTSEAKLASERNEQLQRVLSSKRLVSILLACVFLISAACVGILGYVMASFCLVVLALICLIRYLDANSHLHEVRRRSTKALSPRLSVLKNKDQSNAGQTLAR